MANDGFTKKDWALFRERVPVWQEAYMERLIKEYIVLLSSDENASDRFWKLKDRIDEDRHRKGVLLTMSRSEMLCNLIDLAREGAITSDDLEGFSDDLKARVKNFVGWY